MKRFLLALFLLVITHSAYSQVVDIVGVGVSGEPNSNLIIPNIENVRKVEVGAFYKGSGTTVYETDVRFKNFNSGYSSVWNTDDVVIMNKTGSTDLTLGYFSEKYLDIDESGIDILIEPK